MSILRVPLDAKFPLVCMCCGEAATFHVRRRFAVGWDSHTTRVPACSRCTQALLAYPRYQRWAVGLGSICFLAWTLLLAMDHDFEAFLALLGLVLCGLHFAVYHRAFGRDCLAIGPRFMMLRVRCPRFVSAWYASMGQEEYTDWFERHRCEGRSLAWISQRVEEFGAASRDGPRRWGRCWVAPGCW